MESTIYSIEHRGAHYSDIGILKWGIKGQQELIYDDISEWEYIDSAGMSLPFSNEAVDIFSVNKSAHSINSQRYAAFLQESFFINSNTSDMSLTLGLRASYWTFNNELTLSPRVNFSFHTDNLPNLDWHFAVGLYYQPPFYKELRDPQGTLYPDTKAQRALHFVTGTDYKFRAWDRPFVFTSEIYY